MRYIPTSAETVEKLKKQAKRLQANGGGKHAERLDRVARQHGYSHWHHVTLCAKETLVREHGDVLTAECHAIATSELAGQTKVLITGPEASASQPFVLMATGVGDAWLIDPMESRCACLVWRHDRRRMPVDSREDRLEILWDGRFELLGEFFRADTSDSEIGTRAIAGYPLEVLREALEQARSVDQRIHAIFDQPDALELTDERISELVRAGWEEAALRQAAAAGGRYSPSRNTILSPPQAGGDWWP